MSANELRDPLAETWRRLVDGDASMVPNAATFSACRKLASDRFILQHIRSLALSGSIRYYSGARFLALIEKLTGDPRRRKAKDIR